MCNFDVQLILLHIIVHTISYSKVEVFLYEDYHRRLLLEL